MKIKTSKHIYAHIDCDSFFASCEILMNPKLQNKYVCVGEEIIVAATYNAKKKGIKVGTPIWEAKKILQYVDSYFCGVHMSAYKEISTKLMNYLSENTLDMRIFSIDEAFVEITGLAEMNKMSLDKYLLYLQQDILKKVGIPVSIGVSNTKLKAKVFSKINKPFGIFRGLDQETEKTAFSKISFREIPFIGSKTAKKLDFYILSIQDYIDIGYFDIIQRFGKTGGQIWLELRGVSSMGFSSTKTSKTMGRARAFNREMTQNKKILLSHLKSNLSRLCDELYVRGYEIKNIEIMLIDNNWVKYKKQYLLPVYTSDRKILLQIAVKLLESLYDCRILYRKTGVFTSCIQSIHNKQLSIFTSENKSHSKSLGVEKLFQEIQEKYGKDSLKLGL